MCSWHPSLCILIPSDNREDVDTLNRCQCCAVPFLTKGFLGSIAEKSHICIGAKLVKLTQKVGNISITVSALTKDLLKSFEVFIAGFLFCWVNSVTVSAL